MYPVLFRLGSFEITSFGAMVALGAALGILLLRRELVRSGMDGVKGVDAALVGVLGGLAGAKLLVRALERVHRPRLRAPSIPGAPINALLAVACRAEQAMLGRHAPWFGSSLLLVARAPL